MWRSGDRPLTVVFSLEGEPVGECRADGMRPDLARVGYGDGRVAFSWEIPDRDPPLDPAAVRVIERSSQTTIPDAPGLEPVRRTGAGIKGYVEVRGPEVISGWAWTANGPLTVDFIHAGKVVGRCAADQLRPGLEKMGFGDGRAGFEWRLPFLDPPLDPATVEVRANPGDRLLADVPGLTPARPPRVRGMVEARGPFTIAGWAKGPSEPVEVEFLSDDERLGSCIADLYRSGLEDAGIGDGRAGFEWAIPDACAGLDPARVDVRVAATGERIPDAEGLVPTAPPALRGMVDVRGPEFITGWARGREGVVDLVFSHDGEELGRLRADRLREDLAGRTGFGDGRAGFAWRLPFRDPPLDPAAVEVRERGTGERLPDADGIRAVIPPVLRGAVEERGPSVISGWARGAGGPVRLQFMLDGARLDGCVADIPRQDLAETGVEGGLAGFRWQLPFRDPPVDVARIVVREEGSGAVLPDAPGLHAVPPRIVRGWVELRGPDVIAGWARGPKGPVRLRIVQGRKVLAELVADGFREGLLKEGVGDGRAGFEWPLPFTAPPIDPASLKVVEVQHGLELRDAPGLQAVQPEAVRGAVEECSYRLVAGWAWDGRPGRRQTVEIVQDGEVIGTCTADRLRGDLAERGFDDGRHGFAWIPPRGEGDFDAGRVQARAQPGGVILAQKPRAPRPTGLLLSDRRIEAGWLTARLTRAGEAEPPAALDLVCDGRFLLQTDISGLAFEDGAARLEIELPRQIFDGAPHRLTLHEAREAHLIGGQDEPLVLQSGFNSMVELVTPGEIRGWIIDPDDPLGVGGIELREGDRLLRTAVYGRERPEVAEVMGAARAREFSIVRLPHRLFDGEPHELSLFCGGREVFPHKARRTRVRWSREEEAEDSARFDGAVQEMTPLALKGYVVDYVTDGPVQLEIRVDGKVVAEPMADRYVSALKDQAGHGFHGFDYMLPSSLMNGRRRKIEVRPAGTKYALPPGPRSLTFPLISIGEPARHLAPPQLNGVEEARAAEPALLSLIVLNLDGAHVLEPFLRSIEQTSFRDELEIILVDHGSTDESREIIEAYRQRLPLIPLYRGKNLSFSASCNLGALLAKGRHLVFVNNDIVFTSDALAGMRDVLDRHPAVGLVGLRLLEPRYRGQGRWEQGAHHTGVRFRALVSQDKGLPRLYHPVEVEDGGDQGVVIEPAVTAALTMMRKSDFRAIGGFDEAYHYGYEDVDLALRLRGRLDKAVVCKLDASAVHNRSATREAKLVPSDQAKPAALSRRDARANLDIFIRRFSRHLPRLILRQMVGGGEAWRSAPLRITFVVGEDDSGPEARAARALGEELRRRFGWEPMLLLETSRGEVTRTDVLVSLRPGYELRRLSDAAPGLVTVAWPLAGKAAWDGREDLYQLTLDLPVEPAKAAPALRAALLDLLQGPRRRVAVKAQAENEPHAHALAEAFRALGHLVRLDGPKHWMDGLMAGDELVVAMDGVRAYSPFVGAVNALCLTPGAERPDAEALAAFDHVFEAGDPDVDARALTRMHEELRREFLGGLA